MRQVKGDDKADAPDVHKNLDEGDIAVMKTYGVGKYVDAYRGDTVLFFKTVHAIFRNTKRILLGAEL